MSLRVQNDEGKYNNNSDEASIFYGYLDLPRTLIKIEAGFYEYVNHGPGYYERVEFPGETLWDQASWDQDYWDRDNDPTVYVGLLSGDFPVSYTNEITFQIAPLLQVFKDYSARNLRGYNDTLTASKFMTMVWNHTDGSGGFIFRPFFQDTTTYWNIQTTTTIYSSLDTYTAEDLQDSTVWDVMTKMAEAENYALYVSPNGTFNFTSRDTGLSATSFHFGAGVYSGAYGHTIKKIDEYGRKYSKYYSRVQVKFDTDDTITSYVTREATLTVSTASNPWNYGERTLNIENLWIPDTATADTLALNIFNDYSAIKNEIAFTTTFVPNVTILDKCQVSYDSTPVNNSSLWDLNNWAYDDTDTSYDLIFDSSRGDAIKLENEEFNFISIEIDLDKFESKFIGREA
jgi:hypothetical protein